MVFIFLIRQRACHFLSLEVTRNLKVLKKILADRFLDFVTFILLVSEKNSKHNMEWCAKDYYSVFFIIF